MLCRLIGKKFRAEKCIQDGSFPSFDFINEETKTQKGPENYTAGLCLS